MHPPVIEWWRLWLVILVVLLAELFVYSIERPRAAVIGYTIQLHVCDAAQCARIRVPPNRWGGQYACDGRAETIQDEAADILNRQAIKGPKPALRVRARCVSVLGMNSA